MKVLHILPYIPLPANFGGALRNWHILKHLYNRHDVTVAGFSEMGDLQLLQEKLPGLQNRQHFINRKKAHYHRLFQAFSLFTNHSYWYNWTQSEEMEIILNRLLSEEDYDFVISEFSAMGHFNLKTDAVRIVDAHNVEYENFRRMSSVGWSPLRKAFYKREYEKCIVEEIQILKNQDAIFSTSEVDAAIIKKDVPDVPHFVIPNGVDTTYFRPKEQAPSPYTLVFTGSMGYIPNSDGMVYFLEEIFPIIKKKIPQAVIYVVGNNPPEILHKYRSDSVIITGFVEDVRPYIEKASVYVVPLRMGSGTRLKVLEAQAMKIPIVSTAIGCEGIEVEDGRHLLIRDEPEAFAEAAIRLMEDRAMREQLVEEGYEQVVKKYDWNVIGNSIDDAFYSLKHTHEWA